jgi:ribosome maturation factor RimP
MTTADNLLGELERLARGAAQAEGVDVAWCELKGSEGSRVFRVFIERKDGDVGLADCERVTKRLSLVLDVEDPIESEYTLEVSTPGLDRPLHDERDYERFTGKLARIKTREPVDGKRRIVGRLRGVSEGIVSIEDDSGTIRVPLSIIDSGRLEVEIDLPNRARSRKRA